MGEYNLNDMFKKCTSLTSLDVSGWDFNNITNISSIFICDNKELEEEIRRKQMLENRIQKMEHIKKKIKRNKIKKYFFLDKIIK